MNLSRHTTVNWRKAHWNRFGMAIFAVFLLALALRFHDLNLRPMHTDEAVQADKTRVLWTSGRYVYDPHEYHGPSLYYFTLPTLWLSGQNSFADLNETHFRLVPVIFGAALILLLLLTIDGLGPWPSLWAALLLGISPVMVFYSRYYIQESLLIFASYGFIAAMWRYTRGAPGGWALLAGAFLGLMHATKETWVLSAAAMGFAALLTALWAHWADKKPLNWRPHWQPRLKLRGLLLGAALAGILYSAFFSHPRGPLDSVRAFTTYLNRGGGQNAQAHSEAAHVHEPSFYISRLMLTKYSYSRDEITFFKWLTDEKTRSRKTAGPLYSEALILLLALCGGVAALLPRGVGKAHPAFVRFLFFYALVLGTVYALVPYKTPWCLLNFWHPTILVAGFGAVALLRGLKKRPLQLLALLLIGAATLQLGRQTVATNFPSGALQPGDPRNPWIYAHTAPDILNFDERMQQMAKASPAGHAMLVKVAADHPWPLPWYLRKFSQVGYYTAPPPDLWQGEKPGDGGPSIVIVMPEYAEAVTAPPGYQSETFAQRPNVLFTVYIKDSLWRDFMKR